MKELQLPPVEPQDKGRSCPCYTSVRLYGRINRLMRSQGFQQSTDSRDTPVYARSNCLDSNFAEKEPGLLVETKLNKSQHCALAAKNCYISFAALGGMLPKGGGR